MFSTMANEGHQGDHRYFTTSMRWGELDHMLVFHDELGELDADQRMQRGIAKKRIGDLVEYLTDVQSHFFSALTLIILPRDLERPAVEGSEQTSEFDYHWVPAEKAVPGVQRPGTLYMSGEVRLFPADGQHRAKAAVQAIKVKPDIAREEVPVVLIPYKGAEQVRQLFSDLNLNAKPVSKTTGLDFETRDPLTIITKQVADTVQLFAGRVNRLSNSLPRSSSNVIALNTLSEGTRAILEGQAAHDYPGLDPRSAYKKLTSNTDQAAKTAAEHWQTVIDAFAEHWAGVIEGGSAGRLRDEYVFPHGLGWLANAKAAGQLIAEHGADWGERFEEAVGSFDWARTGSKWQGTVVIHDPDKDTYRVNNTGPAVAWLRDAIVQAARA